MAALLKPFEKFFPPTLPVVDIFVHSLLRGIWISKAILSLAQLTRENSPNSNELIGITGVLGDLTTWELNPVGVGHCVGTG